MLKRFLDQRSPVGVAAFGALTLAAVAAVDDVTGYELSFSIFYLAPVLLMAWYTRPLVGYAFAITASMVWLGVDTHSGHPYSHPLFPVWNTAVRLGFFLVTSYLLMELKTRFAVERESARHDGLTGIANARAFKEAAGAALKRASRHRRALALGYVDVDNFKTVNDTRGHSEGDRVLVAVARALAASVRGTDVVGRLGGDEFAILLPETDDAGARPVFERLRAALAAAAAAGDWPIGFSIGVAVFADPPADVDDALKVADALMYRVKKAGKGSLLFEAAPTTAPGGDGVVAARPARAVDAGA